MAPTYGMRVSQSRRSELLIRKEKNLINGCLDFFGFHSMYLSLSLLISLQRIGYGFMEIFLLHSLSVTMIIIRTKKNYESRSQ